MDSMETDYSGKTFPAVKRRTMLRYGNRLPTAGNTLPHMQNGPSKKVLDVLAENLATILETNEESGAKVHGRRGPTAKTINNIVNKRHKPTLRSLEKLCKALGIEVYQLLCPIHDRDFLTIMQAYNVTDNRGRETLFDNAAILLKKAKARRDGGVETSESIE
jgi:transcriptional regulator with XRE-family HTH domain